VMAVPRKEKHIVLDMAMSQFSFGALESYSKRGEQLPVIGGFDFQGNLSSDPSEIEKSGRPLPIGYWKGSGLSLMLDVVATLLSDGTPTCQIPSDVVQETRLSQVFIAIKPTENNRQETLEAILAFLKTSQTNESSVRYPGERTLHTREQNMAQGIPVDDVVWDQILNL